MRKTTTAVIASTLLYVRPPRSGPRISLLSIPASASVTAVLLLGRESGLVHQLGIEGLILFQELREIGAGQEGLLERLLVQIRLPLRRGRYLLQQVGVILGLFLGGVGRQEEGAQHLVLHVEARLLAGRDVGPR